MIQKQVLIGHARTKSTIKNHFCLNTDHSHKNRTLSEVVSLQDCGGYCCQVSSQYTSPPVFKPTRTRSSITDIFRYQNGDICIHRSLMTVESPCVPSTRSQHIKYPRTVAKLYANDYLMCFKRTIRHIQKKSTHRS